MVLDFKLRKIHIIITQVATIVHTERYHRHGMLHGQVDQVAGVIRIGIIRATLRIERYLPFGTAVVYIPATLRPIKIQVVFFGC